MIPTIQLLFNYREFIYIFEFYLVIRPEYLFKLSIFIKKKEKL